MASKSIDRRRFCPRVELLETRLAPAVHATEDFYFVFSGSPLVVPGGPVILAESGFNDAEGIHADPIPNSPYQFGETIQGRGLTETGWTRSWVVSAGGCACGEHRGRAETFPVFEGDGAAHAYGAADGTWLHRGFQAQFDQLLIEQPVRLPANPNMGSRPYGNDYGPNWNVGNGRFYVLNGDGAGGGTPIDTGIAVVPLRWHKVSLIIDVAYQTYTFFVDGV